VIEGLYPGGRPEGNGRRAGTKGPSYQDQYLEAGKMTFTEFLKVKKGIDPEGKNLADLMDDYYEEYQEYLMGVKDGCGTDQ